MAAWVGNTTFLGGTVAGVPAGGATITGGNCAGTCGGNCTGTCACGGNCTGTGGCTGAACPSVPDLAFN